MKSRGNLKLFYVTIYTHFVASNWRRDCKTVIKTERKRATKSKMADSFPFSITIIVKSTKYWLYRKSRILVDPESHLVSEKLYFCQISDTFKKKKKRDRSVLSEAARERGDYFIIVQSRSLGWAVRNRNVAVRAKVRKAGLFGSAISFTKLAAFRQIESDRFTVESCKSCTSARRYHRLPRLFPRAASRKGGSPVTKKLIEKLIFGRVLFTRATFTRLDHRTPRFGMAPVSYAHLCVHFSRKNKPGPPLLKPVWE